jgi:hypothetical protein
MSKDTNTKTWTLFLLWGQTKQFGREREREREQRGCVGGERKNKLLEIFKKALNMRKKECEEGGKKKRPQKKHTHHIRTKSCLLAMIKEIFCHIRVKYLAKKCHDLVM